MFLPSGIIKQASKYLTGHALDVFTTLNRKIYRKRARVNNLLAKLIVLLTPRMLRLWLKKISFPGGWNESFFRVLEKKGATITKQEQICGIVFDTFSIKSGIYYSISNDKMQGYEDLG